MGESVRMAVQGTEETLTIEDAIIMLSIFLISNVLIVFVMYLHYKKRLMVNKYILYVRSADTNVCGKMQIKMKREYLRIFSNGNDEKKFTLKYNRESVKWECLEHPELIIELNEDVNVGDYIITIEKKPVKFACDYILPYIMVVIIAIAFFVSIITIGEPKLKFDLF